MIQLRFLEHISCQTPFNLTPTYFNKHICFPQTLATSFPWFGHFWEVTNHVEFLLSLRIWQSRTCGELLQNERPWTTWGRHFPKTLRTHTIHTWYICSDVMYLCDSYCKWWTICYTWRVVWLKIFKYLHMVSCCFPEYFFRIRSKHRWLLMRMSPSFRNLHRQNFGQRWLQPFSKGITETERIPQKNM